MPAQSNNFKSRGAANQWHLPEARRPAPVSLLPRIDLEEILNALKRRFWIIALCMVLAAGAMALFLWKQSTFHASYGSVDVKTQDAQMVDRSPIAREKPIAADWSSVPHKRVRMAASLVAGGFLGLVLALFAELLDRRVRESGAVARAIGAPILGTLPKLNPEAVAQLGVSGEEVPAGGKSRHLRGFTPPSGQSGDGSSSLLLTSAFRSDGKSLSALKWARMLAEQGHRTLLIDAHMGASGLSGDFLESNAMRHGLTASLMGEAGVGEILFVTSLTGLWFLPSGAGEDVSPEILATPEFQDLLQSLAPMFDRIVIDGGTVEHVQAIARHVDSTCLVVRRDAGRYRDLREAAERVRTAGGNLAGFVWNEIDSSAQGRLLPLVQAPDGFGKINLASGDSAKLVVLG